MTQEDVIQIFFTYLHGENCLFGDKLFKVRDCNYILDYPSNLYCLIFCDDGSAAEFECIDGLNFKNITEMIRLFNCTYND